jgi:hypothetical protein
MLTCKYVFLFSGNNKLYDHGNVLHPFKLSNDVTLYQNWEVFSATHHIRSSLKTHHI